MAAGRGNKRHSILEAAAHLIRTEGVHAASISEIIREARASAGTIYHHFGSKVDIVLAVAQAAVVDPLEQILARESGEGTSPGELLRETVHAVMEGDVESALIVQLWAGSSREPQLQEVLRRQMAQVHAGMAREIARWLTARGVPDAEARSVHLAHVTMGQAMGLLAERTILTDLDREAYLDEAAALLDAAASVRAGRDDRAVRDGADVSG